MKRYLVLYAATILVMLPLDLLFLRVLAKDFFNGQVGALLSANPNLLAAALFYLLYAAGIVIFVTASNPPWKDALVFGALFGFMCYATFELTCRALLQGWTWPPVFMDIAWGSFVTATAAAASLLITARLLR